MAASLWDPVTAPLLPAGGDQAALPKFHQVFRGIRVHACVNLEILCNYCSQRSARPRKVPVPQGNQARGSPKPQNPLVNGFCQHRGGADGAGHAPTGPTCASSERRNHQPPLGPGKGGEKQNIVICKASTGWWHRGGHGSFPLATSPAAPAPPHSPCPWQCREEEITSEVFCLNLIMARAGFLLLYF